MLYVQQGRFLHIYSGNQLLNFHFIEVALGYFAKAILAYCRAIQESNDNFFLD